MTDQPENQIVVHPTDAECKIVPKEGGNIAVTALEPEDMQQSQAALIEWAERKVAEVTSDAVELRGACTHAKNRKWSWRALDNQAASAERRQAFYEKVLAALRSGYVIIPNFPVSMFAIRTSSEKPTGFEYSYATTSADVTLPTHQQPPGALPGGEGEYRNPFPIVKESTRYLESGTRKEVIISKTTGKWQDMEFPITMAKPQIMQATDRAMALKIFDQLGILPAEIVNGKPVKGDPIIVGQLLDPRGEGRRITFMVAWHLDTRVL